MHEVIMDKKQQQNLAKHSYDLARIIAGVAVITPLLQEDGEQYSILLWA